jgi:hypothetical protein
MGPVFANPILLPLWTCLTSLPVGLPPTSISSPVYLCLAKTTEGERQRRAKGAQIREGRHRGGKRGHKYGRRETEKGKGDTEKGGVTQRRQRWTQIRKGGHREG